MYTLCIIDMQPAFQAANRKRVRGNCIREINQAMKDKAAIIFVEYQGSGSTRKDIFEPVIKNEYKRYYVVTKISDDGGREIAKAITDNRLSHKVKVCGVNTNACVSSSVAGLTTATKRAKVQVISDACGSATWSGKSGHWEGLARMAKIPNVEIK